jgi:chromosome segregation ATPase
MLIVAAACRPSHDGADLRRMPSDLERTTERVRREAASQREGAEKAIEEKLVALERQLAHVREVLRTARAVKSETERHLAALEQEARVLRRQLEEARLSGARARQEVEGAIDRTMEDLEQTFGLSEGEDGGSAR